MGWQEDAERTGAKERIGTRTEKSWGQVGHVHSGGAILITATDTLSPRAFVLCRAQEEELASLGRRFL